jgi:serine/threonine protein kinase
MNEMDRAASVFAAAVGLPTGDRAAYLDRACASDPALRHRVVALLRAHDQAEHFLDQPAAPLQGTVDHVPDGVAGTVVAGRYKLLETIGEGGMGTVWMAEQRTPVKRLVALKLIKAGMDSQAVLARFEAERQALALMDHPNIAKVLDGGTTESGRPYFVMELVKGLPLTDYCDDRCLSVPDRLKLFVLICAAVQHAHQKGILHRDLKPSNILVTEHDGKPVPKVIDFGLAKAVGAATMLTERTLHTAYGTVVGTPLYMAPEQMGINALDVDTRTDLYALGAILYELLTGTTPLERRRFKEVAWDEVKRLIREEEPPRPSLRLSSSDALPTLAARRQTEPAKLSRLVRGDLDWIVLKALEKDRNRRYETANGLSMDLQRHLVDEPVLAAPPSVTYRLRKFLRKRRGPVLAAALVLLALLAGSAGTTWGLVEAVQQRDAADDARAEEVVQRHHAEANAKKATASALEEARQRQIAEANEKKAKQAEDEERQAKQREAKQRELAVAAQQRAMEALRATTDDVIEQLLGARPVLSPTEKAFLQATLKRWQVFAAEQGDSPQARAIRAEGLFRVALLRHKLGDEEAALADYQQAIGLQEQLAAAFPVVAAYRQSLAGSHNNLASLLKDHGQGTEADKHFRLALGLQEQLAGEFPAVPDYRKALAGSHNNLASLLQERGKWVEAENQYRQALGLRATLAAEFPAVPAYRQHLAASHDNLGLLLQDVGRVAEAEKHHRQALGLLQQLVTDFPAAPAYRQDLAGSRTNLASVLRILGKHGEAEQQLKEALGLRKQLVAEFPAVPGYRKVLAGIHNNMGILLNALGKPVEAEEHYRQALGLQQKLVADFPTVPAYRQELAISHNNLGILLNALGKHVEAEEHYRQALGWRQQLAAEFPAIPVYRHELAGSHNNLALVLKALGKRAEAEEQLRQALALRKQLAAQFPAVLDYQIQLGSSLYNFANLVRTSGKPADSLAWYGRAIATLGSVVMKQPGDATASKLLSNAHFWRAKALDQLGRHEEAIKDWDQVVSLGPPANLAVPKVQRALSRVKAGQVEAAVAEIEMLAKTPGWPAPAWYDFAGVYALASAKDKHKKEEYAARAVEFLRRAIEAGYKDAGHINKDPNLDPLRGRPDFQQLLESLAKGKTPAPK